MQQLHLVIVGAGPAGLSAAARAAEIDRREHRTVASYVLLESSAAVAKTIQRYQKGKHVMAEPGFLDLRSDLSFDAGSREQVLGDWARGIETLAINVRFSADVKSITGQHGSFELALADGSRLSAANVLIAIGLDGNPRPIGAPGEDVTSVQYQLDDPREYRQETIVVVGAGDAAIENALALSEQNEVILINRGKEFSRAKQGNLNAVVTAIASPEVRLSCRYETRITSIVRAAPAEPLAVTLETPTGTELVRCQRIIARLGTDPPRRFIESVGVQFPNAQPQAIPALTRHCESNVPGIYIVGSLAGYPLIKQAMNQGYDVAEHIYGNDVRPADYPLLEAQFSGLPFERECEELLERFKSVVPMFRELNALAFRELMIESDVIAAFPDGPEYREASARIERLLHAGQGGVHRRRATRVLREGDPLYEAGEYGTSFLTIVNGDVTLHSSGPPAVTTPLTRGDFCGEMSLLSGRPRGERAVAGAGCIVIETPRRTMLKLMSSNEEVRRGIDWIFVVRELQRHFAPRATTRDLRDIATRVLVRKFRAGEAVYAEGAAGESLFLVRSGSITLRRRRRSQDLLVAQIAAGQRFGEMALMGDSVRRESATATVACDLIEVRRPEFLALMQRADASIEPLQLVVSGRVVGSAVMEVRPEAGAAVNFLMAQGLGEATNAMVIHEALCVGCDSCEKACAETHGGISRLDRKAGASFAQLHVPHSCRHCDQPHCMKDCPPNAIKRSACGEVYIDETCIGCGNCQSNCPYHAIRMAYDAPEKPGLLRWLIFDSGDGPGESVDYQPTATAKAKGKKAVKCDACRGLDGGPACVRACPTGAALRIGPTELADLVQERRR
ncbi:MAG TPA: cyclic nucleotide-binding domain-containing protein [Steroidobacteraceae bacterium]|nr:cyclic nucleotide-binding domain-containing protein [Steroidobacteraceae bacterium]